MYTHISIYVYVLLSSITFSNTTSLNSDKVPGGSWDYSPPPAHERRTSSQHFVPCLCRRWNRHPLFYFSVEKTSGQYVLGFPPPSLCMYIYIYIYVLLHTHLYLYYSTTSHTYMKTYSTKLLLLLLLLLLVIHACIHTHLYLSLSLYIYIYIILLRRRLKARAASLCARPSRREQPSCEFDDANNSSTSSCDVYVSRGTHIYIYIYIYIYVYIHTYVCVVGCCMFRFNVSWCCRRDVSLTQACGVHAATPFMVPYPGLGMYMYIWYVYSDSRLICISAICLQALLSSTMNQDIRNSFASSPVFQLRNTDAQHLCRLSCLS